MYISIFIIILNRWTITVSVSVHSLFLKTKQFCDLGIFFSIDIVYMVNDLYHFIQSLE